VTDAFKKDTSKTKVNLGVGEPYILSFAVRYALIAFPLLRIPCLLIDGLMRHLTRDPACNRLYHPSNPPRLSGNAVSAVSIALSLALHRSFDPLIVFRRIRESANLLSEAQDR
jgi:hypothetical protein